MRSMLVFPLVGLLLLASAGFYAFSDGRTPVMTPPLSDAIRTARRPGR
jgi:hypothetical protein